MQMLGNGCALAAPRLRLGSGNVLGRMSLGESMDLWLFARGGAPYRAEKPL